MSRKTDAFELRNDVLRLADQGYSIREIAKELGKPRSTVAGWMKHIKPYVRGEHHQNRPSKGDMPEWLKARLNATITGQDFQPRGPEPQPTQEEVRTAQSGWKFSPLPGARVYPTVPIIKDTPRRRTDPP